VIADFDNASFVRVVATLEPYRDELVVIGGWANRLCRLHPLALAQVFPPLRTLDADIATPMRIRKRAATLRQLLVQQGFREELSGEEDPPRAEYHLGSKGESVYVQFVAPLEGGAADRRGRSTATTRILGVTAERLRYVDVLLVAPWTIELTHANGFPVGSTPLLVKICNPVAYIVQKILALPKRRAEQRAKDVLYIHDTLLVFGGAVDQLEKLWTSTVRPSLSVRAIKTVLQAPQTVFGGVTDDLRGAAIQARSASGRSLDADRVAAVCRFGLARVLAS